MSYDITSAQMDALQDLHARQPHAPSPHPYEFCGTKTCDRCGCRFVALDISAPNPIEDHCSEPETWRRDGLGCACHSWAWLKGYMDEQDRIEAENAARSE